MQWFLLPSPPTNYTLLYKLESITIRYQILNFEKLGNSKATFINIINAKRLNQRYENLSEGLNVTEICSYVISEAQFIRFSTKYLRYLNYVLYANVTDLAENGWMDGFMLIISTNINYLKHFWMSRANLYKKMKSTFSLFYPFALIYREWDGAHKNMNKTIQISTVTYAIYFQSAANK